jgi:hypothetical protein
MVVTKKLGNIAEATSSKVELAHAQMYDGPMGGSDLGTFYSPYGSSSGGGGLNSYLQDMGLIPEKLVIPREYHKVIGMCFDFYQRIGVIGTTMDRLSELAITDVRNGERKTTNEANEYFYAVLHSKPSRLMRFLHNLSLEYFLSGMVIPRVSWVKMLGKDIDPELKPGKTYMMPIFDWYPPTLIDVEWVDWGKKAYYLRIPSSDITLIKKDAAKRTKEQQLRFDYLQQNYPSWAPLVSAGSSRLELTDIDPILRKETSTSPYPTPYLFRVLEPLVYKQQLRKMDFSVASRVINAILLVQEGSNEFPLTTETQSNLTDLKNQIMGRSNDPRLMERLFMLFSNHTTKISWITPDVSQMLNQEKYNEVNSEIADGLGFPRILLTGQSSGAGTGAEVSTWSIQPSLEILRSALIEWVTTVYEQGAELNGFRQLPDPEFKPIRLQDFIKTAAIFAQAFKEGNISRTSRVESIGLSYETETELMRDEAALSKDLPAFPATPYSPPPPTIGNTGAPKIPDSPGRPLGSQNVPITNKNSGVKPSGQEPKSQLKAEDLWSDEELIDRLVAFAEERGVKVTAEMLETIPPLMNKEL